MTDEILQKTTQQRAEFFDRQGVRLLGLVEKGQAPATLLIVCSDSRIVPELLLGARPGDYFMLRNIANLVSPYWQSEMGSSAVLEYALLELEVSHIVVCGHTDCGGIRKLDEAVDFASQPNLTRWLDLARPAQREVDARLPPLSGEERHRAIVESNVVGQLRNLQSYPMVRRALEIKSLELHGWVYDLEQRRVTYYEPSLDRFVEVQG